MQDTRTVLIADDDPDIREVVKVLLQSDGFRVLEAADGDEAEQMISADIDVYILDIMMPGRTGYQLCRDIRAVSKAPIMFLTAKSQDGDKAMGFSSGADDYLPKPFSYTELLSRVKALLRRYYVYGGKTGESEDNTLNIRDLEIDTRASEVRRAGVLIPLTDIEYRMLLTMATSRKKVFSAQELYETVWNDKYFYSCNNTVMVHIRSLRLKLEPDPANPQYIKTVWGKGYRID